MKSVRILICYSLKGSTLATHLLTYIVREEHYYYAFRGENQGRVMLMNLDAMTGRGDLKLGV